MSAILAPPNDVPGLRNSWSDEDEAELLTLLEMEANGPPFFREFVERTVNFRLHLWQSDFLCPILERLRDEQGLRLAIHGPPQYGKSVIVSQRAPAYLIGCKPSIRIGLAAYNETHATGFGEVVRDLLLSPEFVEMFPAAGCRVAKDAPAGRFKTAARANAADAQPSFLAMGLLSGFTGKGVDVLFIDDPYKSAEDADSEAINEKVWRWWSQTARVRIAESANVVVMFHRYHDDDLAARLLAEGGWEHIRFPAIADANEDFSDPTGREFGELLSPMRSREWLEAEKEKDPQVFAGQFQGRPRPDSGNFFKVEKFGVPLEAEPVGLRRVRAWDLGATESGGDWTAGVLMGERGGVYYVLDVERGQWGPERCDEIIKQTAALDGRDVAIHGAQDPGAAGKRDAQAFTKNLAGYVVKTDLVSGAKETRARAFAAQVNAGNVRIVRGDWNKVFLKELQGFPQGKNDDQVDAAADAFNEIALPAPETGKPGYNPLDTIRSFNRAR
jgi:predicted phage terminase large subunit-like protein